MSDPTTTYALGQAFRFAQRGLNFQNFNVGGTVTLDGLEHTFLPFGFSGVTINRSGDNVDASIVIPNTKLCQDFAVQAFDEEWEVIAVVGSFNPTTPGSFQQQLYTYAGVVTAGGLDDTSITMVINSVLDAVTGEIPHRIFERDNVGPLPITSNIGLQ